MVFGYCFRQGHKFAVMAGGPQVRLTPTNIVFFSFARTAAAQNECIARATFFSGRAASFARRQRRLREKIVFLR